MRNVEEFFADRPAIGPVRSSVTMLGTALAVLLILGVPAVLNRASMTGDSLPTPAQIDAAAASTRAVEHEVGKYSAREGFVGVVTDSHRQLVSVLWRGTPPAGLTAFAAETHGGVSVEIKPVESREGPKRNDPTRPRLRPCAACVGSR